MNAVEMVQACSRRQGPETPDPTEDELDRAGVTRDRAEWVGGFLMPTWTTWCDRCHCDHGGG